MVVLVTGMHRSGTSAMAELLIAGGLDGGPTQTLMLASAFNHHGFFEQLAIVDLNDRLLASVGGHWLAPPHDPVVLRELARGELGAEAREVIAQLQADDSQLVLKDPRFCLTLPFWSEVFHGELTSVVLMYRNPAEVAASLRQRDGLVEELGLHLWRAYNTALLSACDGIEVHAIAYQSLLAEPEKALARFADATPEFSLAHALSQSPLDPELRHHAAADESLDDRTQQILDVLKSLEDQDADRDIPANASDALVELGLNAAAVLGRAHQAEVASWGETRALLSERVESLESERDEARALLSERVESLEGERDEARAVLAERVAWLEGERDEARALLSERVAWLEGERDEARALLDERIVPLEFERDEARQAVDQLKDDLDVAHGTVVTTTKRLEGERDHAREAHRLTGQELATVRRRLRDYERSRTAGIARKSWAIKRRIRRAKARAMSFVPGRLSSLVQTQRDVRIHVPSPGSIALPQVDDPVVSIVIPVYGQLATTAACLESIVAMTKFVPYEVIVVDDCSPDDSAAWLATCPNLRLVTNETNLGYLQATTAGVAASQAPYVCLLNNDTTVTEGWLDALLHVIADDETVGAVGAKLVYPDGTLQEAGAIVFADGSGWNFGRNGDPDAPEVNFVREVDYCSAACLLVRRSCWDAVGGFDERYVPAYYEDADLAFELRAHGWTVMYQPAAVVIHFEGVSHGTDETQGLKAHQVRNKANFEAKWADVLTGQPLPGSAPRIASWRGEGNRVLVIDHEVPAPDQDAGSLRMAAILELLDERGFKVSLLPHNRYPREPYTSQFAALGIEVLHGHISIESYLEEVGSDLAFAVISRPDVATDLLPVVRRILPDLPIAYDMVDFHSLRVQRRAELTGHAADHDEADRTVKLERELARSADVVVAVTEEEATLVRELEPSTTTAVIPTIHAAPRSTADFDVRNGVMFIGSYRHGPNRDAIEWLIEEILPEIWQRDPGIEFHLVGSDLPEDLMLHRDERVTVHGWLPHLDDIFNQVRLNIAPLRFGAGIKGKVGDSLARGVPVVCTDIAAEGFGPVSKVLSVGQSAAEIADLVVQLHNDKELWTEQAEVGVELIEAYFGYEPARRALSNLVELLTG